MADALNIPLKFPFTTGTGELITSLPIKRVKRKDLMAAHKYAPKDDAAQENFLFAKMTGLTIEDLGELDVADSQVVTDVFREMAGGGDIAVVLGRSATPGPQDAAVGDQPADNG